MNRREAVKRACFLGGVISISTLGGVNYACRSKGGETSALSSDDQEAVVSAIAEILVPATGVPGAKAAGIGAFVIMMIQDCYPVNVQGNFASGLNAVQEKAVSRFNADFAVLHLVQREAIVSELAEAASEDGDPMHFFTVIRELTFLGYFTSEVGATQALDYLPVAGRYDACIPLELGKRAWTD